MRKHSILIITMLLVVLTGMVSCIFRQNLEINKSTMNFSFAGGTDFFRITTNGDWVIDAEYTDGWVTISPTSGSNNTSVAVTVERNNSEIEDRSTSFTVFNGTLGIQKQIVVKQSRVNISTITRKVWFLRSYERWDSDFFDVVIPESYRSWTYFSNPGFENWFFYFLEDSTGYQIHTYQGDTVSYLYHYVYYPDVDSLNIVFETTNDSIEDYHTVIQELNYSNFSFSDAYRPHQFEKLNLVNVTGEERGEVKINKKNIALKPKGPIIQLK